jgi:ABC-2 type transport system permease protein
VIRIFDISRKDLLQILRDRRTFLFLLIMPIAFTLLFAYIFGTMGADESDSRLPVGLLDQDRSVLSGDLVLLLDGSDVIRLDQKEQRSPEDLDQSVADGTLAAAVVVPAGFGRSVKDGAPIRLTFITDPSQASMETVRGELLVFEQRLIGAARIARIAADAVGDPSIYDSALADALEAWQSPPIRIDSLASGAVQAQSPEVLSATQSSPGMMLQFAIAGLMTAAMIIVSERKTRSLQRLLTTAASRVQILIGHYLAIFALIFGQFVLLMAFARLFLGVDYLRVPGGTLLVAATAAAFISALGLFIGIFAKSEEQATAFVMIPMFVLSGLGGAWMPLEYTGAAFRAVGHLSPVAWAMDGFKNIIARGLGFDSTLLPAAVLTGYALLFFGLAVWRFWRAEE